MSLFPRLSTSSNFDNLFDHFFTPTKGEKDGFISPKVDVKELDDQYQISAEIPGVKRHDVTLELHDGMLTLSAEHKQEDKEEKEGKIIRQERRYGKFQRSFHIGDQIKANDIAAQFEDGVLTVTLPKVDAEVPQKHKVTIN